MDDQPDDGFTVGQVDDGGDWGAFRPRRHTEFRVYLIMEPFQKGRERVDSRVGGRAIEPNDSRVEGGGSL